MPLRVGYGSLVCSSCLILDFSEKIKYVHNVLEKSTNTLSSGTLELWYLPCLELKCDSGQRDFDSPTPPLCFCSQAAPARAVRHGRNLNIKCRGPPEECLDNSLFKNGRVKPGLSQRVTDRRRGSYSGVFFSSLLDLFIFLHPGVIFELTGCI